MTSQNNEIAVIDHGETLVITFDDCVKYHGRDSIGGLAVGFRLMQLAFSDLAPGRTPDRTEISFATTFGGPGVRDAVEMVSRALTRGVYHLMDASHAPADAPDAPPGPLWFNVRIGAAEAEYVTVPGAVGPEFVRLGKLSRSGQISEAEKPLWTAQKRSLAATVLAAAPGAYLRRL